MQEEKTSFLKSFTNGLKTEYRKIVFPDRQDVAKQSAATIAVSIVIGAIIAGLDIIMKWGLGHILK